MTANDTVTMLVASRQGRDVPVLAGSCCWPGSAPRSLRRSATGSRRALPALLSVWPVAAYVDCMELLTWMRRNTRM